MEAFPVRLPPDSDLRTALERELAARGGSAAFVVAGIGSLKVAMIRLAGANETAQLTGDLEILTLSGTIAANGSHLHMSVSDAKGQVTGGHVAPGCVVRTTAEVLLALLPAHSFSREPDAATGYAELVVRPAK